MNKRNTTRFVIVHFFDDSSLTYEGIKRAHLEANQPEIGFHFIIDAQGQILMGRHTSKVGAHSHEFDDISIGVCVIGKRSEMEQTQSIALTLLLEKLKTEFPSLENVKYIYQES